MSGLRKSTRIRKPVMTTIDQNLDDEVDRDVIVAPKTKKSIERICNKRPSTDDNDELDFITPKKRPRQKSSAKSTTKTSPYFNTKPTENKSNSSPIKETKKARKPRAKKTTTSINENTTLSAVTTKSKFIGNSLLIQMQFLH